MADQDQLSLEDMQALRHVHEQLSLAKDPRAQRVGAYLSSQIQSDPQYSSPQPAPGPGFMGVMGDFISNAPDQFMKFITGHPMNDIDKNFAQHAQTSGDAFRRGDFGTGVGHGLAAFLPGSGDEAVAAGEEFGKGNVGGGIGHTALSLLPMARVPRISPKVGPAIMGGLKGGVESLVDAKTSLPALTGAGIGSFIGGKTGAEIGAGLGAAPGVIKGVVKGAREALNPTVETVKPRMNWPPSAELPRLQAPKPGAPPPSAELPRLQPTKPGAPPPSAELPRIQPVQPGPPPPSAELPRLTGATPVEGRPHWPPAYKPPNPPSSKGIKVDTQPIPIPEPTAKPQPIQPVAAAPTRYDEMVKIGGDVLATHGTTIDSAIAKHLKSKGYTPEDVMGMNEDSLYNLSKGGVPTLRKFGTSGKASRPFATRQKDIFDALSREWGR